MGKFKSDCLGRCGADDLKFAPWNPLSRIDATDKHFQSLVDSLKQYGQFMPILINEHGLVIEGNRRVAACRLLGIPVEYVVKANRDAFLIYQVVNEVRHDIKGRQLVEIFAKDTRALPPSKARLISRIATDFGGTERVLDLMNRGLSFDSMRYVRSFGKKTDRKDKDSLWLAANWTLGPGTTSFFRYVNNEMLTRYPQLGAFIWTQIEKGASAPERVRSGEGYETIIAWYRREVE